MSFIRHFILIAPIALLTLWAAPAWAVDPDLIDVVEITDTHNPIIVHENILPGDTFSDTMTVKNLTSVAQDIGLLLDIDLSQGIVSVPTFELEERLRVRIQKSSDLSFVTLPGGGIEKTLQELDDTTIPLGTLPGNTTEVYKVLVSFDLNAGNQYQKTKVYFNLSLGIEILGETPRLLLRKFNDSVSDEVPGNEVVYTLEVTALGGPVDDVTVTDLPPEGFAYVPGSGEGAPFVHEYASPGIWDLGDMSEGETKTLTYKTTISGSQDAGLYKDLAFAKGVSGTDTLFANSPSTPFVGTDVNVVLPTGTPTVKLDKDTEEEKERKTKTKTQYVLGAATSLPLTGTPWQWMIIALVLLVVGATLRHIGKRNMGKGTVLGLLVLGLSLGGSLTASAANLSVEIETPETLVASPDFKIGFVTLDTLNRPLTVDCFTTLSAVPFASYVLDATFGGNAGNCEVNASALPSDGNYEFFVRARATGEGDETVESNHVTVTLASTFPGTPTNYDRSNPGCDHVITFTTADDGGKTVKVELYRSEDNPFVANSSTKVTEVAIGSNTDGNFTVPAPGCDDDTLYALRAVDAYGHGSGFVGDTEVDIDTVTVTTTRTRTVVLPGSATGAIPVTPSGAETLEPAVQGAETTDAETGSGGTTEAGSGDESVLGAMTAGKIDTWFDEHPWLTGLLAILATLIGYIGYTRFLNRRDDANPLS